MKLKKNRIIEENQSKFHKIDFKIIDKLTTDYVEREMSKIPSKKFYLESRFKNNDCKCYDKILSTNTFYRCYLYGFDINELLIKEISGLYDDNEIKKLIKAEIIIKKEIEIEKEIEIKSENFKKFKKPNLIINDSNEEEILLQQEFEKPNYETKINTPDIEVFDHFKNLRNYKSEYYHNFDNPKTRKKFIEIKKEIRNYEIYRKFKEKYDEMPETQKGQIEIELQLIKSQYSKLNEYFERIDKNPQPAVVEFKPTLMPETAQTVYDILIVFFDVKQQAELIQLLTTGNNVSNKLLFKGKGNRLTDTFKKLIEHDFITGCDKQILNNWIITNFNYLHNKKIKSFIYETVEKTISRNQTIILPKIRTVQ